MAIYRKGVETQFGRFIIEGNEAGISKIVFPHQTRNLTDTATICEAVEQAVKQIQNYFAGKPYYFSKLTYDFSEVTDFQRKILQVLLSAPAKTLAYSELAEMSGYPNSSRAVGTVMNKNPFPILIPCHRVIQASGSMGNYAYGVAWKKRLLEHEKLAYC